MNTYRELTYMVLDELKLSSDDSTFTEDHVMLLLDNYRALLLKQKYSDIKKQVPESNYQEICLELEEVPAIDSSPCTGGYYLRSKNKIPNIIPIGTVSIYPTDIFQGINITFVSIQRMKFTGYNKFLQNIIYCALSHDGHLYFKSSNPQFLYLERVRMSGIFESVRNMQELQCTKEGETPICDILDMEFPLEEPLVPTLIQMVVKELAGPSWRPEDSENNASDDLSNLANFIARNAKSKLQKEIEE